MATEEAVNREMDGLDFAIGRLYAEGLSAAEVSGYLSARAGVEVSERLVLAVVSGRERYETKWTMSALEIVPDHDSIHGYRDLPLLPEVPRSSTSSPPAPSRPPSGRPCTPPIPSSPSTHA